MSFLSTILNTLSGIVTFLLLTTSVYGWPAHVIAVTDGDTLIVAPTTEGGLVRIRLHGIDAPERRQDYGEEAKNFVGETVLSALVEIDDLGIDRYGRIVAVVTLQDGETLQATLLRAGLAWVWSRYCRDCADWESLQAESRAAGRGLWQDPAPVPPWDWRRGKR